MENSKINNYVSDYELQYSHNLCQELTQVADWDETPRVPTSEWANAPAGGGPAGGYGEVGGSGGAAADGGDDACRK
jgi:hypothetical protein